MRALRMHLRFMKDDFLIVFQRTKPLNFPKPQCRCSCCLPEISIAEHDKMVADAHRVFPKIIASQRKIEAINTFLEEIKKLRLERKLRK